VRDVSKELGKDIELVISGAETELDKTVWKRSATRSPSGAQLHGSRNRVGGNTPRARQAGKGTLKLNAYHDAGSIVIEVSDDGGGLNKQRILKKAIERGLVSEADNLSDKEIYNLIFEAGFSTAEKVSSLSGRGVGMDVVRRNITALRGTVNLDSEEGESTTVRIRCRSPLPSSTASWWVSALPFMSSRSTWWWNASNAPGGRTPVATAAISTCAAKCCPTCGCVSTSRWKANRRGAKTWWW